jgi:MFS transporter, ACS family, hexuronate transporter
MPSPGSLYSPWRWWVCGLLFLATTLNYMDRIALNQMAVRIQVSLSLDDREYSRLESGFSLSFAIGAMISGTIVDKVSVRWVYPLAVFGWSAAGLLTGYATGFWSLISCRIMLGLFESANWPCGLRTTRAMLRHEERSLGNSLFQSGTAVGAVITPMLVLFLMRWADPLEPFRNAVMAVTGGGYAAAAAAPTDAWKFPFRAIGCLGVGWVVLWFLTVPRRVLLPRTEPEADPGALRYRDIFRDRRFWAIIAVVIALNISWHTYRAWLPKYLMQKRGFNEADMTELTTLFYILADVGSWTIGLATLLLIRRRKWNGHTTRLLLFGVCSILALIALFVPFAERGWPLTIAVLLFAFASLGLFPTYYALTQEVSAKHQGKVSGTFGLTAHLVLSLIVYPIQGEIVNRTKSYDEILAAAGVFPLLALAIVLWLWPSNPEPDMVLAYESSPR